jgi:Protein of unknown function (DUF3892)
MSVRITHVRYGGTSKTHESIVRYKWLGLENGKVDDTDKASMVKWIDVDKGKAFVGTGASQVPVGVVKPDNGQPYLRTYADGKWSNNLLSLPTF